MVNIKVVAILTVAAFVSGSFVASPELRAFAADTIGSADIIDGSIQSVDIGNGQVKAVDLAGNAVTSAKIADGTITGADVASSTIGFADLENDAVSSAKIADSGVLAQDIGTGQVTTVKIGDSAVTGVKIADGTITTNDLGLGAVKTPDIAGGAVTATQLAANSVTGDKVSNTFIKQVIVNDSSCTDLFDCIGGWHPGSASPAFIIHDSSVTPQSNVLFNIIHPDDGEDHHCFLNEIKSSIFTLDCSLGVKNGSQLRYTVITMPTTILP